MCDWPNREDAMTVIERRADGKPSVWCDPCIAPLVRALNTNGLRTAASSSVRTISSPRANAIGPGPWTRRVTGLVSIDFTPSICLRICGSAALP